MTGRGGDDLRQRARMLLDVGREAESLPLLQRLLANEPDDADALCRVALAHMRLGDRRRQLEAAERALASDPQNEWACRLQFDALHGLGRKKQAVAAARRALELAPQEPLAHVCLVQGLLALHKAGSLSFAWPSQRREVRERAEHLVELAPSLSVAHQTCGLVALDQRRLRDAEESFRRALALDPESATDLNNLGVALLRQRRNEEALEAFEGAARLDPSLSIARSNLAVGIKRNVTASVGVLCLSVGYFVLRGLLPRADTLLLSAAFLVALFALYARRLRRLSPTAQRFARTEGLIIPGGIAWWRYSLLLLVFTSCLIGVMAELVCLVDRKVAPTRPLGWLAWGAMFALTLALLLVSGRHLRRVSARRG